MTYCPLTVFDGTRKVNVDKNGISLFNGQWPGSTLRPSRCYWFEFDADGDLIDTDCPEHDDGPAVAALADDCRNFLFDDIRPAWLP